LVTKAVLLRVCGPGECYASLRVFHLESDMANPLPQQERVAAALQQAKTQETEAGLEPSWRAMWDGFTDDERHRILQLPKADRVAEIQRYHAKKREAYRTNPFLRQIQAERESGQPKMSGRTMQDLDVSAAGRSSSGQMPPGMTPEMVESTRRSLTGALEDR